MNILENVPDWNMYASDILSRSRALKLPATGTFELTPRCNLNCQMCYVHLTKEQMDNIGRERTAEEWIDMGRQTAEAGTLFLLLTGGEPFLRSDFRQIYEALSQFGLLITIFSNGTLIDENTVEWLAKIPPAEIRITIYGASNSTYEAVCGVSDGFDRMVNAVKLLKNAGLNVSCSSTIIKSNLQDVQKINQFAKHMDVGFLQTSNVVAGVRGASQDVQSSRLSASQSSEFGNTGCTRVDALFHNSETFESKCKMVNCGYCITWDGKMVVCSYMGTPCTYPFETGFKSSWQNLKSLISEIKEPEKCTDCMYKAFCMNCPGILSAESGSYKETSDRVCEQAKANFLHHSINSYKQD